MLRLRFHNHFIAVLIAGSCLVMAQLPGHASQPGDLFNPSLLCDQAAASAAAATGVPLTILRVITRVETGRTSKGGLEPWPWAVNRGGAGDWFSSAEEAIAFATAALQAGTTNIDIGCFQLNHHFHGEAFPNVAAMFDPEANARYAAGYLLQLLESEGSWKAAVAAYHSRTPSYADRYIARVEDVYARMAGVIGQPVQPAEQMPAPRENRFMLLRPGAAGTVGSLVPQAALDAPILGQ